MYHIHMGISLCKQCGYRWNHPQRTPKYCPSCKSPDWDKEPIQEGDACEIAGCICDQCGCKFFTGILQAHYCPNCGSREWDKGRMTENSSVLKATENPSKEYECTKCGHHWFSRCVPRPKQCPRKPCQTRKIREVIK